MTEEKNPNNQSADEDLSPQGSGTDWGEDWDAAFQAEDDLFSGKASITDFPLEDLEERLSVGIAKQASGTKTAPPDDTTIIATTPTTESAATPIVSIKQIIRQLASLSDQLKNQFLGLSLYQRILTCTIPILVFLGIIVFITLLTPKQPTTNIVLDLNQIPTAEAPSPLTATPEKERTKWSFPDFFIPVTKEKKSDEQLFVSADLTLIILLDKDETIEEKKQIFLRDLIYQFYSNRTLYELRRYSLARGEMNNKLRDWIRKQWPTGDLETIVFNRYQVS
ncbi:MAG: hypothetical protein KKB30_05805 [Proteobacteria bacterium]|nr:hypothetical protein [Pseudomonadota bacterium]MBU1716214.1 hypothetical protein [Pseudomonadota bacterium]